MDRPSGYKDRVKRILRPEQKRTPVSVFDPYEVLRLLAGEQPSRRKLGALGNRLAKLVERKHPFTSGYLFNVLADPPRQEIGKPLRIALRAFWMAQDGELKPPFAGAYEPIELKAIPGRVEPGAYVLAASIRCANPKCMTPFVPKIHNQIYCSTECKNETRRLR